MSQHMDIGDWWEQCDKIHVFQRWAEKYDKTLLADAWIDFCQVFSELLSEILPRPNSYWDLDDSRKETFIDWLESTCKYEFPSWLESAYADAMEPGWGTHEAE